MRKITFNKNSYKSKDETYKDFYHDLCLQLDRKNVIDWQDDFYKDLRYNADFLDEFLWYCSDDDTNYVFVGIDIEKIENYKTYDQYEWSLILKVFNRFVEQYPNNTLEFKDCEENEEE